VQTQAWNTVEETQADIRRRILKGSKGTLKSGQTIISSFRIEATVRMKVGSQVAIVRGRSKGRFGRVERQTESSVVVGLTNSYVMVRKTSVKAIDIEEVTQQEEEREMKVLGRFVARHLVGRPEENSERMHKVFWDELQKSLGVIAMTEEEEDTINNHAQEVTHEEEEVEEMKVLGQFVGRRMMGPRGRGTHMHLVFWNEMQKSLGPE
jgi:hypothetical protein